jgi:WD40 repeat protein
VRAVLIRILLTLLVAGTAFIQGLMGGSAHSAPPQAETPSAGVSSFPPLVPEGEVFQDLPQLLRNISWRDPVYSVAIGPDGKRLAAGGDDGTVTLWDTAAGREIARLEGNNSLVLSVAFSPDGKLIASGYYDGTVRL